MHWWKSRERGALASMVVNGLGATATAVTVMVVAGVKFIAGGLDSGAAGAVASGTHARDVPPLSKNRTENAALGDLKLENLQEPIVIVPILEWSSIAEHALRFAMTLSDEIEVLHIESEDSATSLKQIWPSRVEHPAREAKQAIPRLTVLKSPFRFVVQPILDYVLEVERKNPNRRIAVLLPELVERQWYQYSLHNQRARILAARLLAQGAHRIVIVNVPWYLRKRR